MEYFNKEDFKQLQNLPRSEAQKQSTMNRIRNNNKQPRTYPIKYILTSVAVVLLAIILIVPELLQSKQQTNEPVEEIPNEIPKIDSDEIISTILNSLDIGLSEEEVTQIFEEYLTDGSVTTFFSENIYPVWHYRIQGNKEYILGESYIDIAEFDEAEIDMLLFIYWDEQRKVEHYSAIYKDGTDGQFYDIRKLKDHTVIKHPISTKDVNTDNLFVDLNVVKTQLEIGMTMDEVIKQLGDHFEVGVDAYNGTLAWTYNFGEEPDKSNDGFLEDYEFEEMLKGKFQAQFHVYWDQNNLFRSIYGIYLNKEENRIYEFGFTEEASKDQPI